MKKTNHSSEYGQALILFVIGIAIFTGFVALSIDGGMLLSDRRQAQNAADSAAMAAALARMSNQDWQNAGLTSAAAFDYDNNGVENWVSVHNPPLTGLYATHPLANQYIQVFITSTLDTSFAQIVFSDMTQNTVMAVARARATQSLSPGNALHATNPTACNAVTFSGSSGTIVTGGHVFSNSSAHGSPTSCHSVRKNGSSGDIVVNEGGILAAGTFRNMTGDGVYPEEGIHENQPQQTIPPIPTPDCSGLPSRSYGGGTQTLQPGIYNSGIRLNNHNDNATLSPGMYCLRGDFSATGGTLTGNGVFIYMETGAIDIRGNANVNLTRSSDLVDASGNQWAGMIVYMPTSNTSLIDMNGNSGSIYTGTIYAPGLASPSSQPKCSVGGNGDSIAFNAQVICNTVEMYGNGTLNITFNEEDNYSLPPIIELVE